MLKAHIFLLDIWNIIQYLHTSTFIKDIKLKIYNLYDRGCNIEFTLF